MSADPAEPAQPAPARTDVPAGAAETHVAEPAVAEPGRPAAPAERGLAETGVPAAAVGPVVPSVLQRGAGVLVAVVGGLLSVLLALLSGALELFLAPLRVGGILIGVAALAAIPLNMALAWFAVHTVGRQWAIVLPWATWTVLMFVAAGVRTDEGDYLLSGDNWVGMLLILLGSLAFALVTYRRIMAGMPRR